MDLLVSSGGKIHEFTYNSPQPWACFPRNAGAIASICAGLFRQTLSISFFSMSFASVPFEHKPVLDACQARIGYRFQDTMLLYESLTHASGASDRLSSNERLEFLGDAVLGFLACELLYHRYPELHEGELTQIKSILVSRATCTRIGNALGLADFLLLGKGVDLRGGVPGSLIANAFESILAAVFLDGGMLEARKFLLSWLVAESTRIVENKVEGNFKSELQQRAQKNNGAPPVYHVVAEEGPDHKKVFQVCAQVGNRRFTPAWGSNKKQAEQRAAANAIAELDDSLPPFVDAEN
jgi:ribonuclease III